jgi:hypothetical protein
MALFRHAYVSDLPIIFDEWLDEFNRCYNETPYTSFCMVEYLVDLAGLDYKTYLQNPIILLDHTAKIRESISADLQKLINMPGRCTSFALQVVQRLEAKQQTAQKPNFQFYDCGPHRAAWCSVSKKMIDSSSILGQVYMPRGLWTSPDGTRSWKAEGDLSKYRHSKDGPVSLCPLCVPSGGVPISDE